MCAVDGLCAGTDARTSTASAAEDGPQSAHEGTPSEPKPSTPTRECAACQVKNELDARFCKACGKSMAEAEESQP